MAHTSACCADSFVNESHFIMKSWLKSVLQVVPGLPEFVSALTSRYRMNRRFGRLRREVRDKLYAGGLPITVQAGCFRGLLYYDRVVWGILTNKWLGSYEHELADVLEKIISRGCSRVIDVGCAEGWYLVGLATRLPTSRCHGFDIDPVSRWQCRKLAALNAVLDRIQLHGRCDERVLQALCGPGSVLICDIEGGEVDLLCTVKSPVLLDTDILVEVHEVSDQSSAVSDLLKRRFDLSHQIQEIRPVKATQWVERNEALFKGKIDKALLIEAAQEHRAVGNHWLWMQVRTANMLPGVS